MIKLEKVSKSFGSVKAVSDVSFELSPGQILGFLGPNGAGKTTTMRMICGFLAQDSGNVEIDGVSVEEFPQEAQKNIGYLPENNPLYKDMLVCEHLELAADLNKIPKEKRKEAFDFVVKAVGIEEVFCKPVQELSKGYKQRLGIAMALIHKPKIIIMDEPTEGLDPNQRKEIRALIKKLSKDHTIILSTHVMQEASAVCDRLLVIKKGEIVADGSAKELAKNNKGKRVLLLELEGDGIEKALEKIDGVKVLECEKEKGRIIAKLESEKDKDLRPEISSLIVKKHWTIFKLVEEERGLEELFQDLTK